MNFHKVECTHSLPHWFCILPCILLSVLKILLTWGSWMPRLRCTYVCQFFSHNQIDKCIIIKINSRSTNISYLRKCDYVLLPSLLPRRNSPHLLKKHMQIVWWWWPTPEKNFPQLISKQCQNDGDEGRFCYCLFLSKWFHSYKQIHRKIIETK